MTEEYFHQDYPKMLYHEDGRVAVVDDADAEKQQKEESGWHDSPAEYGVETAPAAPTGTPAGYVMQGYKRPERPNPQPPPPGAGPEAEGSRQRRP